ncbi:FAD binding domain-containing protein [Steroidobacter agaridevorans]|uniref:FAD binding domain-containing protein n=1 Tax=Steroidobacter agaridevorans TaxID=2695856 RepID=UPI001324BA5C|nr:xanthine dehydrogenase family protein subunit M [Steroidobacter agaridevorans]GFE87653.1 carbon monoxide dehydrogenase [Steroidobacter agaridevorans]
MKPAPFDYYAPKSVEEACALLAEAGGGATVLAGGQTLLPLLALRMSQPFVVIDINRIESLKFVSRADGGTRIGPVVRQSEIISNDILKQALPVLVTAAQHVGHHQTRNRGTIGGSIALGEPAAELPATAVALGASIEVRSVRSVKKIRAEEMYLGPYATALSSDELITSIDFPEWPVNTMPLFREIARRPGDFALAGLVGAVVIESGRIARAGIAWFGMGPTPIKARQAEAALVGQSIGSLDAQRLAELAIADADPFDDRHATAEYRRTVARRIFVRTLSEALKQRQAA